MKKRMTPPLRSRIKSSRERTRHNQAKSQNEARVSQAVKNALREED